MKCIRIKKFSTHAYPYWYSNSTISKYKANDGSPILLQTDSINIKAFIVKQGTHLCSKGPRSLIHISTCPPVSYSPPVLGVCIQMCCLTPCLAPPPAPALAAGSVRTRAPARARVSREPGSDHRGRHLHKPES